MFREIWWPRFESAPRMRVSTALGIGQSQRPPAQLLPQDPILLPEIVDQVFLVAVHPTSDGEHEEVQRMWHRQRLPDTDASTDPASAIR